MDYKELVCSFSHFEIRKVEKRYSNGYDTNGFGFVLFEVYDVRTNEFMEKFFELERAKKYIQSLSQKANNGR
ncbi:MAG: hypothetical protein MJ164_03905 [Alphaproteobacteria bacterium]|nr:hypothetical protein [Alphaproteobacteria bacterium]